MFRLAFATAYTICTVTVTPALGICFALYLNRFIRQQVAAKDATIQSLQAAHTVYEARISSLEAQRAPELAKDLQVMVDHSERVTKEKNELVVRVNSFTAEQKESQKLKPLLSMMYEIEGLTFASETFKEAFTGPQSAVLPKHRPNVLSEGLVSLTHAQVAYSAFSYPRAEMTLRLINAEKIIQHRIETHLETVRKGLKGVSPNTRL